MKNKVAEIFKKTAGPEASPRARLLAGAAAGLILLALLAGVFGMCGRRSSLDPAAMQKARELVSAGNFQEAAVMADDFIRQDKKNGFGHMLHGIVNLVQGRYLLGDEALLKAIKLGLSSDDRAIAYYNLGISAARQRRYNVAEDYLKQTLKIRPGDLPAQETLQNIERWKNSQDRLGKYTANW
ncbi:MAG: tetratricopeptide repeat protein [Candidatus Omnitrophota bacterium]